MAQSDRAVAMLAQAYSMSELLPVEDPRIRRLLAEVADGLEGGLVLEVEDGGLRVGDRRPAGVDAFLAELAVDLELAGVKRLAVADGVDVESLAALIRSLRETAAGGEGGAAEPELAGTLTRIEVVSGGAGPRRAGVAGSVAAVFRGGGEGDGSPQAGAEGTGPDRVDLEGPLERRLRDGSEEAEEALREAARGAADAGRFDAVADAVARLALEGTSDSRDESLLRLARNLLTPAAAARVALRLGSLRDEEERQALLEAVGGLGREMAASLADALVDTDDRTARRIYIDAMVELGDDARPEAEAMLDDSRWFVVRNGVRILGGIGEESDVQHLTSPLAHDDARVRRETVRALARIGGEDAGMLLVGMLDDPDPDVRAAVATSLGALGVERAGKALLRRLEEEDSEKVQVQIIRGLGALGDPGAVPAIEKRAVASFFSRPPRRIRIAAYRALASIGTPHATELLQEAREDRDEEVRSAVRDLLNARAS